MGDWSKRRSLFASLRAGSAGITARSKGHGFGAGMADYIPPIAKGGMDGALVVGGLVVGGKEQASARTTAGPSAASFAKGANDFAQDDSFLGGVRKTSRGNSRSPIRLRSGQALRG
jgi:hypothetical protein